jgi:hypothetical protein
MSPIFGSGICKVNNLMRHDARKCGWEFDKKLIHEKYERTVEELEQRKA